jgi:hypothetical protein
MDAVPMEIERYIYGKVDKVEHIKALIDRMTVADFEELREVATHIQNKLLAMRVDMFVDLKKVWVDMVKSDKKSGLKRAMYIEFRGIKGHPTHFREFVMRVDKFAVKYIHGCEEHRGLPVHWYKIACLEYMDRYWIE